jgi:hypothetical protein
MMRATENRHREETMNNADQTFHIALTGNLRINPSHHEDLPELSEGLPKPTVSIEFDDGAWTYIEVLDESVHFWTNGTEGTQNSWHNDKMSNDEDGLGPWEGQLNAEQIGELLEWGSKVHERIDAFTYWVMTDATQDAVKDLMLAIATDNTVGAAKIPGVTVTHG